MRRGKSDTFQPGHIMDSFEQALARHPMELSGIWGFDPEQGNPDRETLLQRIHPAASRVNMLAAAKSYYDVGYEYMLMPDHVPVIPGDKSGYQAFAFAFGYIQAAIQMFG